MARKSPAVRRAGRSRARSKRTVRTGVLGLLMLVGCLSARLGGPPGVRQSAAAAGPSGLLSPRLGEAPRLPEGARRVGLVANRRPIDLVVALRSPRAAEMARLAVAVSTPGSTSYRHYLPRGAFAREFGASASELRTVTEALRALGLPRPRLSGGDLALQLSTTAAVAEHAFHTRLVTYRLPSGRVVYANDRAPLLSGIARRDVVGVMGLDSLTSAHANLVREHPSPARDSPRAVVAGPTPNAQCAMSISQSGAGYNAQEIASAYDYPALYAAGDGAAGATVALIEFAPYRASDVATYAQCYAGITPSVRAVRVDGGPGPSAPASQVETELDIEDLLGLAPRARVLVYEGPNGSGSPTNAVNYDTIAAAVDQDSARVISTSWGECEPAVGNSAAQAEGALFEQAALQGQTVVAAAGDSGSEDCYDPHNPLGTRELAVDDPASQPFVTGVGGTELSAATPPTERVWNTHVGAPNGGAGGGGISAFWAMPAYQELAPAALGVINSYSPSGSCGSPSGHCREVPDISADAGAPYAIYCTETGFGCSANGWTPVGGTSAASPTIAALFALANASPKCLAAGPIGFANPALYAIASGPNAASAFSDVTSGNNDYTGTNGRRYPASVGYDLASGLGTPIAGSGSDNGLVSQLCSTSEHGVALSALPVPQVTAVVPSRGHPGESVTVVGRDFGGATTVRFGTVRARFHVAANDHLVATVPAKVGTGPVHVTVSTSHGGSPRVRSDVFLYLPRPSVSAISPPAGPATGGTAVTIVGAHLGGATLVRFGARPAVAFTVLAPTRLRAVSPPGTGTITVTVVTGGGTSVPGAAARFHYAA